MAKLAHLATDRAVTPAVAADVFGDSRATRPRHTLMLTYSPPYQGQDDNLA